MPPSKITLEEKRMRKRLYMKERHKKIRSDPELDKIQREKDRKKYLSQKVKKKKPSINMMDELKREAQRARWKINSLKYRKRKKKEFFAKFLEGLSDTSECNVNEIDDDDDKTDTKPPLSKEPDPLQDCSPSCSRKIKDLSCKMDKETRKLHDMICDLKTTVKIMQQKNATATENTESDSYEANIQEGGVVVKIEYCGSDTTEEDDI